MGLKELLRLHSSYLCELLAGQRFLVRNRTASLFALRCCHFFPSVTIAVVLGLLRAHFSSLFIFILLLSVKLKLVIRFSIVFIINQEVARLALRLFISSNTLRQLGYLQTFCICQACKFVKCRSIDTASWQWLLQVSL